MVFMQPHFFLNAFIFASHYFADGWALRMQMPFIQTTKTGTSILQQRLMKLRSCSCIKYKAGNIPSQKEVLLLLMFLSVAEDFILILRLIISEAGMIFSHWEPRDNILAAHTLSRINFFSFAFRLEA